MAQPRVSDGTLIAHAEFKEYVDYVLAQHTEIVLDEDLVDFGFTFFGPWEAGKEYEVFDAVERGGELWLAVKDSLGKDPELMEGFWTSPGAKGPKGDTGAQGIQGEKGVKGDTGAQGEKGTTGEAGPKGEKGDTGAKGDQGTEGAAGPQGEKGVKGDTGEKGVKGDTGAQGIQGEKGAKGDTGAEGPAGVSTFVEQQTFAIQGAVTTAVVPGFFVSELAGEAVTLKRLRAKITGGTNCKIKLQVNGSDATGFTALEVTTTAAQKEPTAIALANNDIVTLVVESVSGSPVNLSATVTLERAV